MRTLIFTHHRHSQLCRKLSQNITYIQRSGSVAVRAMAASAALVALTAQVEAKFSVCNRSFDVLNVAIGTETGNDAGTFTTTGWWTVGANACVDPISDDLKSRYLYVYVRDVFGQPVLNGNTPMCVRAKKFEIIGAEDCWQRGLVTAKFLEVDTRNTQRWTLFLSDTPEQSDNSEQSLTD